MPDVYRTELTPLSFLERSALVYPHKTAIVEGDRRITYQEMADRSRQMADALDRSGIGPGDRVAFLCTNIPEMLMAHFSPALLGAVLVAVNVRLSPEEIRYILDHSGAKLLVGEDHLLAGLGEVIPRLSGLSEVVSIDRAGTEVHFPVTPFDRFMARGSVRPLPWTVDDEERTISINYTSGTTGRPKGVMYTHRGAYLNALGEIIHSRHSPDTVYLWTLPMFHCNGWCTTWGVTAIGGTHVCLPKVDPADIWSLIDSERVTHFNAAPTVLISLAHAPQAHPFPQPVTVTTAGATPSPTIIKAMEDLGAQVVHMYGLTETYGPHTVCELQPGVTDLPVEERARFLSRQGVSFIMADPTRVVDDQMQDIPQDASTLGEVVMRGNNVMKGYFDNPEATQEAFAGGFFHSGDIAVWHPDGYIDLRDRSKDIIISGGENISTIEVEKAIASHPAVLECAVIAIPHERWGERPKAFVVPKIGEKPDRQEIIDHVRSRLARFKAPDEVEMVQTLPKTSTGKIQKFVLRDREWGERDRRIN
ncbi:MAG: AMP-binding protein [Acidimicrobiia bacterium]|nr:acyl--CoA ligase family protein [bacterium]MXX64386.1 AMP-binding protein [Acidimicrobiia bacterium]